MNYKSFNLVDWIGHISGVIEDESELDGNEMRDLVEFLSGLPKWIPVSERLPEKCGYYLCSLYYAVPPYHVFHLENDIYIHDVSVQKFDGKSFIASVKAWMPLPEPFKAESEDKE